MVCGEWRTQIAEIQYIIPLYLQHQHGTPVSAGGAHKSPNNSLLKNDMYYRACEAQPQYLGSMLPYLRIWSIAALLLACTTGSAQYIIAPLCKASGRFNDSTPRCVVQLRIPPNTVRVLYSISINEATPPAYAGLDSQATALLPDKLGWMGISAIAAKIKGTSGGGTASVYFYDSKRCVEKFATYEKKNCKAHWQMENCRGGTFDIPWQATLFPQNYYLCLINPHRYISQYFAIEAVAIVAE